MRPGCKTKPHGWFQPLVPISKLPFLHSDPKYMLTNWNRFSTSPLSFYLFLFVDHSHEMAYHSNITFLTLIWIPALISPHLWLLQLLSKIFPIPTEAAPSPPPPTQLAQGSTPSMLSKPCFLLWLSQQQPAVWRIRKPLALDIEVTYLARRALVCERPRLLEPPCHSGHPSARIDFHGFQLSFFTLFQTQWVKRAKVRPVCASCSPSSWSNRIGLGRTLKDNPLTFHPKPQWPFCN